MTCTESVPVIARPAIARRLSAALDSGSLLLMAPAGSGKTMALEEALAGRPGDVARLRCTALDRHAGRLLDRIVEALRQTVPGAADVLAEMLAAAFGAVSPEGVVRELVAELERLLIDPLTLVFDDAEHLADDHPAAAVVGELVASDSRALRVAVASRRPLPLRLAKLRATDRLTVLAAPDLAFSADELEALLCGAEVSEDEARSLLELTEGWPLGVVLTLGARRAGCRLAVAPRSAADVSAFLLEEVLEGLDADFRTQLLKSSLPSELTARITAAIGLDDGSWRSPAAATSFCAPSPAASTGSPTTRCSASSC